MATSLSVVLETHLSSSQVLVVFRGARSPAPQVIGVRSRRSLRWHGLGRAPISESGDLGEELA